MARGDFFDVADYSNPKQSILNPTGATAPAATPPAMGYADIMAAGNRAFGATPGATAPATTAPAPPLDLSKASNSALNISYSNPFTGAPEAHTLLPKQMPVASALSTMTPGGASALAPAAVKPNPIAAADKVAAAPPSPSTGVTGKVKGYLELAGAPSSRENLMDNGTLVPGATSLSAGGTSAEATAMTRLSDRYASEINAQQAPATVSEPMYGEGGRVIGYRSVVATPQNSFQGRSVEEILGPNDAGRMGRAAALGTLQNEAEKTKQDAKLKQAQGYKAIVEGQKAEVETKFLPDEKKADIGGKIADAVAKEAEARSKLNPSLGSMMKDGSPADAAWATKAQAGITAGTHTWAPETQFSMLDDAGKTSVPYKMYGTLPASAAGKKAYDSLWGKYLGDVKAYNSNMFRTESDLTALKTNRAAFLNGMRSLGLRIDPIQTLAAGTK